MTKLEPGTFGLLATCDWKPRIVGKKGALIIDLLKAFDCLYHELLIVKLNACGFSLPILNLFYDYLLNRKQRIKIFHIANGLRLFLEYHKDKF